MTTELTAKVKLDKEDIACMSHTLDNMRDILDSSEGRISVELFSRTYSEDFIDRVCDFMSDLIDNGTSPFLVNIET